MAPFLEFLLYILILYMISDFLYTERNVVGAAYMWMGSMEARRQEGGAA
jgi:hypothetical protein